MEPSRRECGYRKWRKAVARATDWLDDDEDWSDAQDGGPLATIPLEGGALEPGE
jgi:hypothetical protein